jgi:phosphate-selective porin OprO/OprP
MAIGPSGGAVYGDDLLSSCALRARVTRPGRRGAALTLAFAGFAAASLARAEDAAPTAGWRLSPLELAKPSAGFRLALKGYLQADFRSYPNWRVEAEGGGRGRRDPFEWRRFRIGFEGAWKRLFFELALDPAFDRADQLKDASVGFRLAPALRLQAGYLKLPVSPEFLRSPSKDDTVERAAVVEGLAPARDWGVLLRGDGRHLTYQLGLFDGDGRGRASRSRTTVAARLLARPLRWLDAGGSFSRGEVRGDAPAETAPNGLAGKSLTGFTFAPAVAVDGTRWRWGSELRLQTGPVAVWGELVGAREERPAAGAPSTLEERGWSATATWLVTGERKTETIRPGHPLFGGPGAVELMVRCEALHFEAAAGRSPAGFGAFQAGVSWWPARFLRMMGDVVVERYDDALRAPEPGRTGHYVSFVARAQLHIPQAGSSGS